MPKKKLVNRQDKSHKSHKFPSRRTEKILKSKHGYPRGLIPSTRN